LNADPAVGLGQIEAADPAFDLELFKRQAVQTFLATKQAIEARDLTDVVDLLSDRVYDDLRLDVEGLLARDAVPHFDAFGPSQVVVAAAERGPLGDAITLRIQAEAMELSGAFTEFWTFSRPLDATTPAARPNECPNCGAPIDVDTGRICHYCKTLLPAPHAQTGWVVAAIRPAGENPE
jgi:inner membrane protein import complex subunit Tim44-like protein